MTERELQRHTRHRLAVLWHVEEVSGSVAATCRYYGISRQCYYRWQRRYEAEGLEGLKELQRPAPHAHPIPVQRFVERVLGATVAPYFNEIAAAATVSEFLRTYAETRTDLAAQVRNALQAAGMEARLTTLGEFRAEDEALHDALKRTFEEQQRGELLIQERDNARLEAEIDEERLRVERRRAALELDAEIGALGRDNVAMIHIIKAISGMQVPNYIGGGDISSYIEMLPMSAVAKMMDRVKALRTEQQLDGGEPPRLTKGEDPFPETHGGPAAGE